MGELHKSRAVAQPRGHVLDFGFAGGWEGMLEGFDRVEGALDGAVDVLDVAFAVADGEAEEPLKF